MPFPIQCPGCQRKLNVPDAVMGRRVKCPQCATSFEAKSPSPSPSASPPDTNPFGNIESAPANPFDTFDTKSEPSTDRAKVPGEPSQWSRTRTGLTLVMTSVYLLMAVAVVAATSFVMGILGVPRMLGEEETIGYAIVGCMGLFYLGSIITNLVGLSFCVNAPSEGGAKVFAIIALVFAGLGILGGCPGMIIPFLAMGAALIFMVAQILHIFFLRACAINLNNKSAASGAIMLFVGIGILIVVGCAGGGLVILVPVVMGRSRDAGNVFVILSLGLTVMMVVLSFIWLGKYIGTIQAVRLSIYRHLNR